MKALLDGAAAAGQVLPRQLPELYENVRDFHVYAGGDGVGGLAALHIDMVDLAEVRSLVVRPELRGRGKLFSKFADRSGQIEGCSVLKLVYLRLCRFIYLRIAMTAVHD